jgi:hypothetical protein
MSSSRLREIDLKKQRQPYISLAASVRASNSALVLDVVTVRCLVDFQSIGQLKRKMAKPGVLRRVTGSSAYAASLPQKSGATM